MVVRAQKLAASNTLGRRLFNFVTSKVRQKADQTWFRGEHCNFNPASDDIADSGATAPERFILQGWLPEQPIIGPDTKLIAFGSCFAENIANWLAQRNFNILTRKDGPNADAYVVRFGEGMVNSFAIRQQFEWAFEGKVCTEELWHGYDAQSFGYNKNIRLKTRAIFDQAEVFIITLGLPEIWYDEVTGGVFWRAVPFDKYDSSRHKFRVSSVAENKENIHAILDIIEKHRPGAKVILTMSPIPLVATFRPVSCIVANQASKAILRGALDEVLRERDVGQTLFYWPSYELVMDFFANRWDPDRRHVKRPILDFIMVLFEKHVCHGAEPKMTVTEALVRARAAEGTIPKPFAKAMLSNDWQTISEWRRTAPEKIGNGVPLLRDRLHELSEAGATSAATSALLAQLEKETEQ